MSYSGKKKKKFKKFFWQVGNLSEKVLTRKNRGTDGISELRTGFTSTKTWKHLLFLNHRKHLHVKVKGVHKKKKSKNYSPLPPGS